LTGWIEKAENLAERGYDLSAKNPSRPNDERLPHPSDIIASLLRRNRELQDILQNLKELVSDQEVKR
jgi:type I restriction enzyme M protein